MAYRLRTESLQELQKQLEKAGASTPGAMKRAVYSGAKEVADAVKRSVQSAVSEEATGDLAKSLTVSRMKADGNTVSTSIGFSGYDRKGVPNPTKAAVLESGRSGQPGRKKTHFFSRAVAASRDAALKSMENEFLTSISDIGE